MKYLYIDANNRVSFDEDNYFLNGKPQSNEHNEDASLLAKRLASSVVAETIIRLSNAFKNVAVLTAAGTSMDNGANSGKSREGLWKCCEQEINALYDALKDKGETLKANLDKAKSDNNIEDFLSIVVIYEKLNGEITVDGESLRGKLQQKISDVCTLKLDASNMHHADFLRKLTARKPSDPRVQLYTTNYDTLFEQAAMQAGLTVIDGFSFSNPRKFNGVNFDYDIVYRERSRIKPDESFIPNVFQLLKVHGSIDWWKSADGNIYQKDDVQSPCIIYPASDKYESSYEQPYIELIAHFQQTLRKEGTLLIVIGFGFKDKHLQSIIKEAVNQNSHFHLIIVCYGTEDGVETGIQPNFASDFIIGEEMKVPSNVSVLFSTFKDFVEAYPLNQSYTDNSKLQNATI
ncbi:MAG: SIR2 family protein [Bacteroidales bacterium]|nr:SIR2 family protein [Bacteroidales bacterium]